MERLKAMTDLIDKASKIHPIASVGWSIISSVLRACQEQLARDQQLGELVSAMVDAYRAIDMSNDLKDGLDHNLTALIDATIRQTVECAIFIRDYCGHGFLGRTVLQTFKHHSQGKIEELTQSFRALQRNRTEASAIQAVIVTSRMESKIDVILDGQLEELLQRVLRPIEHNTSSRPLCLPQTRTRLLQQISTHLTSLSDDNILWMHGIAGCGKSTIAKTVSTFFDVQKRLAAYIAFDRHSNQSSPQYFIRTLAYQLATFHPLIRKRLLEAGPKKHELDRMDMAQQFDTLISGPLLDICELGTEGPLVIVLDALDECGSPAARANLLSTLKINLEKLPRFVRVFITSRPEIDIRVALGSNDHVFDLDINSSDNAYQDIKVFLQEKLSEVAAAQKNRELRLLEQGWPKDGDITELANRASGLFIWAQTLFQMIEAAHNPAEQLKAAIEHSYPFEADPISAVNQLFANTLASASCNWNDMSFRLSFDIIFGTIAAADRAPLRIPTIDELLSDAIPNSCKHTLQHFESIVVIGDGKQVTMHPSFCEYLTDRSRCGPDAKWYIDLNYHRRSLALRCMEFLSLHIREVQQKEVRLRIQSGRDTTALGHASLYWFHHIAQIECGDDGDPALATRIGQFLLNTLNPWFVAITSGSEALLHLVQSAIRETLLPWVSRYGDRLFTRWGSIYIAHFLECYTVQHIRDIKKLIFEDQDFVVPIDLSRLSINQYRSLMKRNLISTLRRVLTRTSPPGQPIPLRWKSSSNIRGSANASDANWQPRAAG
ncbi:hypothetical protein BXZ70DRAFT_1010801 [Cristinia sonorae]|uniref:Nephrocystin 3-like N-terminal domain-containing protein n=1 Tax=Cristinia sonorae TaxID=1940300 RepID=A0A8K0UHF6_9AGAR|nr:hypothetical protein BXZ70DRAFT_1010801 [Cristinia sonorae]